jgi:hypothetical protein
MSLPRLRVVQGRIFRWLDGCEPRRQPRLVSGDKQLPPVYFTRHGETVWTISGPYTDVTELPLTERSEGNARRLGDLGKSLTYLATAALSIVGYNHGRHDPMMRLWNDCGH